MIRSQIEQTIKLVRQEETRSNQVGGEGQGENYCELSGVDIREVQELE